MGGEPVEGAADGAAPRPLVELAVSVKVGPAVVAPGKEVALGTPRRRVPALVHRGEGRDGDPPRDAARLHGFGVHRKAGDARPDRHRWSPRKAIRIGDEIVPEGALVAGGVNHRVHVFSERNVSGSDPEVIKEPGRVVFS